MKYCYFTVLLVFMLLFGFSGCLTTMGISDEDQEVIDAIGLDDLEAISNYYDHAYDFDFKVEGDPLIVFAADEQSSEILQFLLDRGFDPDTKGKYGRTPLMYATVRNNVECIQILLSAGADINALQKEGQTALIWGSFRGNDEIDAITALVNAGADLNIIDKNGGDALTWAIYHKYVEVVRYLVQLDGIRLNEQTYKDTQQYFVSQNFEDCLEIQNIVGEALGYEIQNPEEIGSPYNIP